MITGAKASNLEKGPRKVWAVTNKDAKIQQLELQTNFTGPLGYMELLKQSMHELTGVPAQALGTMQPISNTSGVALSIQYQPLMLKHERKSIQYTRLFERINELIIKHAFMFAPELTQYNPYLSSTYLKPDQMAALDPSLPVSYRTYVDWPSPMPIDRLLKINEIQALMAMNLESRRGALRDLGVQFPDQKIREIFEEVLEDTKEQGALSPHPEPGRRLQHDGDGYDARWTAADEHRRRGQPCAGLPTGQPGDGPRSRSSSPTEGCRRRWPTSSATTARNPDRGL